VEGAIALMALTRQDPLRWFMAFGSLSGRWGGNGLSDYAAANDAMAKLVGWFRNARPDCASTCCHWQNWDLGMSMLTQDMTIIKSEMKIVLMPTSEGLDHLHQEFRAGLPEAEVLFTDGEFERMFYSQEMLRPATGAAVSTLEPSQPIARPLIERTRLLNGGAMVAEVCFQPARDPFLVQHRLRGKPFLPGVLGLETIAQAGALWKPEAKVIGLRDVEIVNGLLFHGDDPITAQVSVVPVEDGAMCRLTTELRDRKNRLIQAERLHVQGIVEFGQQLPTINAPPPGKPPLGWFQYQYVDNGLIYHGESLRCFRECCFQYEGGWGKVVAPALAELAGWRASEGWIFTPAVMDACVVACGGWIWMQFGGRLEVPHGFRKLRIGRQPCEGETCVLRIYMRGREAGHSFFDFTLFGEDESVIVQAEGYRTVSVGEGGN